MKISVVIATCNRCRILAKSLDALLNQSLPSPEYEILMVDDGSVDETREFMREFCVRNKNVFYFEQDNKGPAAARNTGIRHSRGKYIFFTGDDIIASRDLLRAHLDVLESHQGAAVSGLTLWDKTINVSRFMDFLPKHGYQFDYRGLTNGQYCSWKVFYTSNVSLEKSWFEAEMFDEGFLYPAWEDIELAYRLFKRGLRIIFNEKALAFHRHAITDEAFYNKMRLSGISRVYFYRKHPELATVRFRIAASPLAPIILKGLNIYGKVLRTLNLNLLLWKQNLCYYTVLGIREGLRRRQDLRVTETIAKIMN